tara:strand:+ start:150 stop:698 length:549 start_codon:yes stop_codon:yes gene_type:complete
MKIFIIFLILICSTFKTLASTKQNIIQNLYNTQNLSFNFEQNINGKIENGNCKIKYPRKIYCKYNLLNEKILVSNGKSLVIKTSTSYFIFPLEKTYLDLILDKKYLVKKINSMNEKRINKEFINFDFNENNNEISIYFDKETYNLIGWQTLDIYQNLSITLLSSVVKNQKIDEDLFKLPSQD